METTANGTSPFQCGFGCRAPAGRVGTGLRSRSHGTTAPGADRRVVERGRRMVPDGPRTSVAGKREGGLEIRRQRRADVDRGPRHRMLQPEPVRMEKLPFEPEIVGHAVDGVAADGKPDRLEVDADLVRPPGLEPDVEERVVAH